MSGPRRFSVAWWMAHGGRRETAYLQHWSRIAEARDHPVIVTRDVEGQSLIEEVMGATERTPLEDGERL